jgi:cytoskeleton protein RodZ
MDDSSGDIGPAPLGDLLKRERIRRKLSLKQASAATRVREGFLDAIEQGQIRRLLPTVFAIGLVQTYARFLQCDERPYVDLLRSSWLEPRPRPARGTRGPIRRRSTAVSALLPGITGAIALLLLTWYLIQQFSAFQAGASVVEARPPAVGNLVATPLPTPPPESTTAAVPSPTVEGVVRLTPPAVPATIPATVAAASPIPSPTIVRGVRIDVLASGRVWLQVEADGKVSFSGIINAGDRKTWNASSKLLLWSGNAGNVSVVFNGKSLGLLGAPGEVVKVTWVATS